MDISKKGIDKAIEGAMFRIRFGIEFRYLRDFCGIILIDSSYRTQEDQEIMMQLDRECKRFENSQHNKNE